MNSRAGHFGAVKPVRTTVRADLVAGMRVEITVVAHAPAASSAPSA